MSGRAGAVSKPLKPIPQPSGITDTMVDALAEHPYEQTDGSSMFHRSSSQSSRNRPNPFFWYRLYRFSISGSWGRFPQFGDRLILPVFSPGQVPKVRWRPLRGTGK